MNYIDQLATEIRRLAEPVPTPFDGDSLLYRVYAVLCLAKGEAVTAEDVHNAWAVWALEKDSQHLSLIPFDALPAVVQQLDEPYVAATRQVAAERARLSAEAPDL
jgi:hypothetical protein